MCTTAEIEAQAGILKQMSFKWRWHYMSTQNFQEKKTFWCSKSHSIN